MSYTLSAMSRVVILACVTIALIQHQANDNHVRKQGQPNTQTTQDKTGAPSLGNSAANPSDQKSSGEANKNQNQPVSITSIPKIAVKPEKDVIDWTIVVCTIVLTIIGIIGTFAAVKTLKQIKRQADTLEEH
jgi:preprotein translocase subunit Sss1